MVLVVKNLPANAGDLRDTGLIPGSGWSPGEGNGNPLQSSHLENSMGRGAWQATVYGIAKSRTQLKRLSTHVCKKRLPKPHSFFSLSALWGLSERWLSATQGWALTSHRPCWHLDLGRSVSRTSRKIFLLFKPLSLQLLLFCCGICKLAGIDDSMQSFAEQYIPRGTLGIFCLLYPNRKCKG